ncbi:hypothetical protein ABPG75_011875 [Micractinium tetrahymenae]
MSLLQIAEEEDGAEVQSLSQMELEDQQELQVPLAASIAEAKDKSADYPEGFRQASVAGCSPDSMTVKKQLKAQRNLISDGVSAHLAAVLPQLFKDGVLIAKRGADVVKGRQHMPPHLQPKAGANASHEWPVFTRQLWAVAALKKAAPSEEELEDMTVPAGAAAYVLLCVEYKLQGKEMPAANSADFAAVFAERLAEVKANPSTYVRWAAIPAEAQAIESRGIA